MDPNAALEEARAASKAYWEARYPEDERDAAIRLSDAFDTLDQWISKGGFLPKDWVRPGSPEWDAGNR